MKPRIAEASDAEWDALLADETMDTPLDSAEADLLDVSDELTRVSRRIAGHYAQIFATFSAEAFRGSTRSELRDQVEGARLSMLRLAHASRDGAQIALLDELGELLPGAGAPINSRRRDRALAGLRTWIPRYAATLSAEDEQRLLDLVAWDRHESPLLEELSGLRGIGPKRLGRLYSAGLHTVTVVANADPEDIRSVTGLPRRLSEEVVEATRTFAIEERMRCVQQLRERAARLTELLRSLPVTDDVGAASREALLEVERAMNQLVLSSKEET